MTDKRLEEIRERNVQYEEIGARPAGDVRPETWHLVCMRMAPHVSPLLAEVDRLRALSQELRETKQRVCVALKELKAEIAIPATNGIWLEGKLDEILQVLSPDPNSQGKTGVLDR